MTAGSVGPRTGPFIATKEHRRFTDALIGFRGLMLQRGPRIVTHFEGR